jgi:hypothetical protein
MPDSFVNESCHEDALYLCGRPHDISKSRGIKIIHQNIQSLGAKIDYLRLLMHELKRGIHILTLSETWTNEGILVILGLYLHISATTSWYFVFVRLIGRESLVKLKPSEIMRDITQAIFAKILKVYGIIILPVGMQLLLINYGVLLKMHLFR